MGWRFLAEVDRRIILWRNTIALFHQLNKPGFVGPFRKAGYVYRVEPILSTRRTGEEKNPDMVASSSSGWLLLELTCNDTSKEAKLDAYKQIEPRSLSQYGLQVHRSAPDTICSRLSEVDDGNHCQLIVRDVVSVRKLDCLSDAALKLALQEFSGTELTKLPNIAISLLPESKNHEVRRGLVDIVMQIFQPDSKGKTAYQMVEEGLDKLADKVSARNKTAMMDRVKREMDVLMNHDLKGYLELGDDGTYAPTDRFREHPMTLERISSRLWEWANPAQQSLGAFDPCADGAPCGEHDVDDGDK
jgi:hypothetical protein